MSLTLTFRKTAKEKYSRGLPSTATIEDKDAKRCVDAIYENIKWLSEAMKSVQGVPSPSKPAAGTAKAVSGDAVDAVPVIIEQGDGIIVENSGENKWKISTNPIEGVAGSLKMEYSTTTHILRLSTDGGVTWTTIATAVSA